MIAAEVDRFYRQVVRDFIENMSRNEFMVRELQLQGVFLHQIEESMLDKLANPTSLFKRLTQGYNEIEKEMMSRYATVEEIVFHERRHRLSSGPRSRTPSLPSESNNDDLECYSQQLDSKHPSSVQPPQESDREEKGSVSSDRRRPSSELSLDDLSEFDAEYGDTVRRLRQNAKIHILGTYDWGSKKHDFKHDLTEIALDNVFIKVEGVAKEIVLKKLHVLSRKRAHH